MSLAQPKLGRPVGSSGIRQGAAATIVAHGTRPEKEPNASDRRRGDEAPPKAPVRPRAFREPADFATFPLWNDGISLFAAFGPVTSARSAPHAAR